MEPDAVDVDIDDNVVEDELAVELVEVSVVVKVDKIIDVVVVGSSVVVVVVDVVAASVVVVLLVVVSLEAMSICEL